MPTAIQAAFAIILLATVGEARVVQLHIERRETVLNGKQFGLAGAYEKLSGKVRFVLDPAAPRNAGIVIGAAPQLQINETLNRRPVEEIAAEFKKALA